MQNNVSSIESGRGYNRAENQEGLNQTEEKFFNEWEQYCDDFESEINNINSTVAVFPKYEKKFKILVNKWSADIKARLFSISNTTEKEKKTLEKEKKTLEALIMCLNGMEDSYLRKSGTFINDIRQIIASDKATFKVTKSSLSDQNFKRTKPYRVK